MLLEQKAVDAVCLNIVNAPANGVESDPVQLLDLFETLDARIKAAGPKAEAAEYDRQRIADLRLGITNAPGGVTVYHEKLHLLEIFKALAALAPTKPKAEKE